MPKDIMDIRQKIEYLRNQYGSYRKLAKSLGISDRTVRRIAHGESTGLGYRNKINRRVRYFERERELKPPAPRPSVEQRVKNLIPQYGSIKQLAESLGVHQRTLEKAIQQNKLSKRLHEKLARRERWYGWQADIEKIPKLGLEPEDPHLGAWAADWTTAKPGTYYVAYAKFQVTMAVMKTKEGVRSVSLRAIRKMKGEISWQKVTAYRTEILGYFTKEKIVKSWPALVQERLEFMMKYEPAIIDAKLISVFRSRKPADEVEEG